MLCLPPGSDLTQATSSIDTRTELRIQKAFDTLMEGRTSFVVAHRLSTVRDASLILVMKDGSVIEQGIHETSFLKRADFTARSITASLNRHRIKITAFLPYREDKNLRCGFFA